MPYTRKTIEKLSSQLKAKPVLNELLQKVSDSKPVSLAEEDYVCSMMRILRNEKGEYAYDINTISACDNYRFRRTYMIYAHDLKGKGLIRDYFGSVSGKQKEQDVKYLESVAKEWEIKINGKRTTEALWNNLIDETKHQIGLLKKFEKIKSPSKAEVEYQTMSIYLHSQYVYLQVKEFFQDEGFNEIILPMYDKSVLVDSFCFIHTLFRHFAPGIKNYQIGKSYHVDRSILYKELPNFLAKFVRIYSKNVPRQGFNFRGIDFVYKKRKYAIWFREFLFKGKRHLRVQTFFPLEDRKQLKRVQGRKKVKINSKLILLVAR